MGMRFFRDTETVLFDTKMDPEQLNPLNNDQGESKLLAQMIDLMQVNDAPLEAFVRLGLEPKN